MSHSQITSELASEIIAAAAAQGITVEAYLRAIASQGGEPEKPPLTPAEKAKAFHEWAENFPVKSSTPLSDEAISRESIYAEREEKQR